MAMDNDLRELLQQSVTVALVSSRDEFNARTFATGVAYPARVVEVFERIVDFNGAEVLASTVVWIGPETTTETMPTTMNSESQITLPDASTPPILAVHEFPDETGSAHHLKVFLGTASR